MSDSTLSLGEFVEAAPFIDIALDTDDASSRKTQALEPLSLGAKHGLQLERLHPALLRAHIALARLLEASRELDPSEPPLKFLLLSETLANLRRSGSEIDLENILSTNDGESKRPEAVASLLQALPSLTQRTVDQGFNRQRLIEIASILGCSPGFGQNVVPANAAGSDSAGKTNDLQIDDGQFAALLQNWHEFTELSHRNLDTLVVSAIAFARFWQLKPLSADNSVAAHLLWQLLLVDADLCKFPALALCEQISLRASEFDRRLTTATAHGDAQAREEWVLFCVELIEQAALLSLSRIHNCRALFQSMRSTVSDNVAGQHGDSLYKLLCQNPIVKIKHVVDADIAKRQTASIYLNKLVECGLLQSRQSGRSKSFYNHAYLNIFGWSGQITR